MTVEGTARVQGWAQLSFEVLAAGGPFVRVGPELTAGGEIVVGQSATWGLCGSLRARYGLTVNPILFGPGAATGPEISISIDRFLDDGRFLANLFSTDRVDGMVGGDAVGPGEKSSRWVKRIEPPVDLDEDLLGCIEGVFTIS